MTKDLFHIVDGKNEFNLFADLKEDGTLVLEGIDFCSLAESMFGDSEYEYQYFFDSENTKKLSDLLPGDDLLDELAKILTDTKALSGFLSLCAANGIKYDRTSWFG